MGDRAFTVQLGEQPADERLDLGSRLREGRVGEVEFDIGNGCEVSLQASLENRQLRIEVLVQRAAARSEPCAGLDVTDTHAVEAPLGDQLQGGVYEPLLASWLQTELDAELDRVRQILGREE